MENWQLLVAVGGLLTPIVLAAMSRDRTIMNMMAQIKDDVDSKVKAGTDQLHDRIGRVRDEYVRRDDLEGHLSRMEKQFDDIRSEMRRASDSTDKKLEEIAKAIRGRAGAPQ